jgi:hypothetical protein
MNYRAEGSLVSAVGTPIGQTVNLVNLNQGSAIGVIGIALAISGLATGGLVGFLNLAAGGVGVNVDRTHRMQGMELSMYLIAGLAKALDSGALVMKEVPISQVTGHPWSDAGSEPMVIVFKDASNKVMGYVQPEGSGWKLLSADQQTTITVIPSATPGMGPTCTVKQENIPAYDCVVTEKNGEITRTIDRNRDGHADTVSTEHVDDQGAYIVETKNLDQSGAVINKTVTKLNADHQQSETKTDNNGDGKWDQISVSLDTNNDGVFDKTVSTGNSKNDLLNADKLLDSLHDSGKLGNDFWHDYTEWSTGQLLGGTKAIEFDPVAPRMIDDGVACRKWRKDQNIIHHP